MLVMQRIFITALFIFILLPGNTCAIERGDQIKIFKKKIESVIGQGKMPIIDVELHCGEKIDIDALMKKMDSNGVVLTWLGPTEKLGSDYSLQIGDEHPDYFVPTTVHGDGKLWHGSDKAFLDRLARDAHSGKYFAMGEFEARHYISSTNNRDVHMPVDAEAMQVVFEAASTTGLPFLLHHEAEDAMLPELERMLSKYPKAKVIWCHVGRNRNNWTWKKFRTPDGARELLMKYPNLYFDLVQSKPGSRYRGTGAEEAIMYNVTILGVSLDPEWKKLFEEFPDRFVIGSDINTGRFDQYDRVMETFRGIVLVSLKKEVAEGIAFKNAWRLMTGINWQE
jgi:predicted TIM-barrel fold metal-dependent hydrolase